MCRMGAIPYEYRTILRYHGSQQEAGRCFPCRRCQLSEVLCGAAASTTIELGCAVYLLSALATPQYSAAPRKGKDMVQRHTIPPPSRAYCTSLTKDREPRTPLGGAQSSREYIQTEPQPVTQPAEHPRAHVPISSPGTPLQCKSGNPCKTFAPRPSQASGLKLDWLK